MSEELWFSEKIVNGPIEIQPAYTHGSPLAIDFDFDLTPWQLQFLRAQKLDRSAQIRLYSHAAVDRLTTAMKGFSEAVNGLRPIFATIDEFSDAWYWDDQLTEAQDTNAFWKGQHESLSYRHDFALGLSFLRADPNRSVRTSHRVGRSLRATESSHARAYVARTLATHDVTRQLLIGFDRRGITASPVERTTPRVRWKRPQPDRQRWAKR